MISEIDFGLRKTDVELIISVLKKYSGIDSVYIFGSRAKNTYQNGSDIDIAVVGNETNLSRLHDELDELPLPYKFDILDYKNLKNEKLKLHIQTLGIKIYSKNNSSKSPLE
jgi:predicted nucleotidyltransferase